MGWGDDPKRRIQTCPHIRATMQQVCTRRFPAIHSLQHFVPLDNIKQNTHQNLSLSQKKFMYFQYFGVTYLSKTYVIRWCASLHIKLQRSNDSFLKQGLNSYFTY